jgi:hypothetical protein
MNPGDIVMYTFQDLRSLETAERPAIVTSRSIGGSCDSARNLHVLFEPRDMPQCRPPFADDETRCYRKGTPFGNVPGTWHRRQA